MTPRPASPVHDWLAPAAGARPRLEVAVSGLKKRFGPIEALRGLTFFIDRPEIFGIVGPDGAGKTTLLRILAGLSRYDEGDVSVLGHDPNAETRSLKRVLGYVPQTFSLYPSLTVDENLIFVARCHGLSKVTFESRRRTLLAVADLLRFTNARAETLSGGMKQKLALCCALLSKPSLIVLDEPTAGIDVVARAEFWATIKAAAESAIVLVATNTIDEADRCDRVLYLIDGRSVAIGTPQELRKYAPVRVYILVVASEMAGAALKSALEGEPDVVHVERSHLGLRVETGLGPAAFEARILPLADRLGAPVHIDAIEPNLETSLLALEQQGRAKKGGARPTGHRVELADGGARAIRCEGLVRRFGDFKAVDGLSLAVEPGEVFGLLGANGSGKSTTIKMLTGLLKPTAGTIEVAGVDVVADPLAVRERIGYVAQKISLYPNLTISENIAFYGGIHGLAPAEIGTRAGELSSRLGLDEAPAQALARDLPVGIRQRLAMLLALLHRPRVLFLDEPTASVDLANRRELFDLMHELARGGMTILVTSHHLDEMEHCDRLALIYQGRLVGVGRSAELKESLTGCRRLAVTPGRGLVLALLVRRLEENAFRAEFGGRGEERSAIVYAKGDEDVRRLSTLLAGMGGASVNPAPPSLEEVFTQVIRGFRAEAQAAGKEK